MENNNEISRIIKEKRLALNLTSNYVAKQAGITRATLSYIENGFFNCSFATILKVLQVLDMSITINDNSANHFKRKRATRSVTLLDKKINSFIIMCIEQYAKEYNANSQQVYTSMKDKGIIDDLKNDYMDLHGMSTLYLNEYIHSMLEE